jgi:hypothetical protein
MAHKIVITTFNEDISQFMMFCYCINKNWNGNRFITVVVNSVRPYSNAEWEKFYQQVVEITQDYLSEWTVEIHDGRHTDNFGYREQAVNKVLYGIDHRFEDVIVFDCKDFLLKPADLSTFKKDNKYRVTYWKHDQKLISMYPEAIELLDQDLSHVPGVINLTPWIWNVNQLAKYWKYMTSRFGDYSEWGRYYKGGTESDTYFAYTYCDPDKLIKFLNPRHTPLLISGGWSGQTYEGMLEQADQFDQSPTSIIWKHNRRLPDLRSLEVTKSVLSKYGIEQAIIDRVFTGYKPATRPYG